MRSVLILLTILVMAFSVWCFDSNPANVYGLTLDRNVLKGRSQSRLVKVWTLAADPENDALVFNFVVSAGTVLDVERTSYADGSTFYWIREETLRQRNYEVIWDLSDVPPGEHKITAGVDDGCGLCGMTQTQIVSVDPSTDEGLAVCPTSFRTTWISAWTKTDGWFVRLLAIPSEGQRYVTIPSLKWRSASNRIGSLNGSPLATVDTMRKQQLLLGSFVRDPVFTSPLCDISSDFNIDIRGTRK